MNLLEKLAMSGYAGYVWSAYGISLATLIFLYFYSKKRLKKATKARRELEAMVSDESQ